VKIVTWLARDRHQATLGRMLVLAVAAPLPIEVPAVPAYQAQYLGNLHADQCGIA